MPTICDECGKKEYAIYLTKEYKRLCGDCYDKVRPKRTWEPEDIPYRDRSY